MVARGGIEPPTYRFSGGRSYQLSYLAAPVRADRNPAKSSGRCAPVPSSGRCAGGLVVALQDEPDQRRVRADRLGHHRQPGGRRTQ